MSAFDVRIHAIRRRPDRRRQFEVRWHAAGRARSRSFITGGLADSYRAELIRAARKGLDFSPGTGEPASWAPTRSRHHQLAGARGRLRRDEMAPGHGLHPGRDRRRAGHHHPGSPHTRAGQAARSGIACRPVGHAFNPARAGADPGPPATAALAWASDHCLPLTALADLQVTRRALEALALRLDGTRAAATTITRKRAVFHGCLSYAAELGLLDVNPLDRITWRPPKSSFAVDPRSAATPAEVQAILGEVTQIRPELTAFFGCLYYAALRPAEAVALRADSCTLPARGWGQLTLTGSLPRSARAGLATNPTRTAQPQTPPGRRQQDGPDPPAARPPPELAPADLRMRRRRTAVPGRPRRPAQRKPLRPDLVPGPHRSQPRPGRHPGGTPPPRPAPCRPVAVAGLRRPARRDRCPRRAQRPCPAHHLCTLRSRLRPDRQPAHRPGPPPQPLAPRWPTRTGADPRNPVRHTSVPQLDSTGHSWT